MQTANLVKPLQIAIAYADPIVAFGLDVTLNGRAGLHAQRYAVGAPLPRQADVIVCDFETGVALAQAARSRALSSHHAPRVLVFEADMSEHGIHRALSSGVQGCVLSRSAVEELDRAVRAVAAGQRYLTPDIASRVAESIAYVPLTARESDVLEWLGAGQCNKAIARNLGISVTTVKAHVKSIMEKLKADSRTQAVSVAAKRGLVGRGGHAPA